MPCKCNERSEIDPRNKKVATWSISPDSKWALTSLALSNLHLIFALSGFSLSLTERRSSVIPSAMKTSSDFSGSGQQELVHGFGILRFKVQIRSGSVSDRPEWQYYSVESGRRFYRSPRRRNHPFTPQRPVCSRGGNERKRRRIQRADHPDSFQGATQVVTQYEIHSPA